MESSEAKQEAWKVRVQTAKSKVAQGLIEGDQDPEYLKRLDEANLSQQTQSPGDLNEALEPIPPSMDHMEGTSSRVPRKIQGHGVNQPVVTQWTLIGQTETVNRVMSINSGKRELKPPTPIERQHERSKTGTSDPEDDILANAQRWAIRRSQEKKGK